MHINFLLWHEAGVHAVTVWAGKKLLGGWLEKRKARLPAPV